MKLKYECRFFILGIAMWYGNQDDLQLRQLQQAQMNDKYGVGDGGPPAAKVGSDKQAVKAQLPAVNDGRKQPKQSQQQQQLQKPKVVQQQQSAVNSKSVPKSGNATVTNATAEDTNINKDSNRKPTKQKQTASKVDSKPDSIVLATTNSVFLDFTRNWLESIRRLKRRPTNITIVTEDEATYKAMAKYPEVYRVKPSFLLPSNKTLVFDTPEYKAFVNKRPKYILDLLERNHDVLFSDVDTVWLEDPFQYFTGDFDMFIQEDQPAPKLVHCAGFAFYRSTQNTINFVKQWIRRLEINKHKKPDQMVLNIMLREKVIRKHFKVKILDPKKFVSGRVYFDAEWRKNHTDVKPVFLHNNWIIGHDVKVDRFKTLGFWFI